MTNYFYHHGGTIYSWCNDGYCKPVDQSCISLLHNLHYQFIQGRGTEVPTIDPGGMLFCEDTCQEGFDGTKVNAIDVNEEGEEESDKYSEDNSLEKMHKKKSEKLFQMMIITKHLIQVQIW